jgi:hypothetical protein
MNRKLKCNLLDHCWDDFDMQVDADEDHETMAGPSRHGLFDDEDDERTEVVHPTAGKVIRMEATLHDRWRNHFGGENENDLQEVEEPAGASAFHPFESRLDWQVACWAIEEGIGHGALDRLLAIPGVSIPLQIITSTPGVSSNFQVKERLELSYHNTRALHKVLDDIPPRAEWHSKKLAFEDRPEDEYTIYYRNPIDAMRSLLGSPAHAKDIVYRPKKIFRDKEKSVRIYNEMWTGKWWHAIQVCFLPPVRLSCQC